MKPAAVLPDKTPDGIAEAKAHGTVGRISAPRIQNIIANVPTTLLDTEWNSESSLLTAALPDMTESDLIGPPPFIRQDNKQRLTPPIKVSVVIPRL